MVMTRLRLSLLAVSVLLASVAAIAPATGAGASPGTGELWVSRYDGSAAFDEANSVAANADESRVFVTGRSSGIGTGYDYATVAYNGATGSPLWAQRYNGTGNSTDEAQSVAVSPDGTKVFVTGDSKTSISGYDYATAAYNASNGTPLWVKLYNGLGNVDDFGKAVRVSPDGTKVFVTGYSYGGAINYDYATVAYDAATGAQLWARRFDGLAHGADYAQALTVSPDGAKVYVTGYANMGGSGNDYVTQAYSSLTGNAIWGKAYNGTGNSSDYAYSVAVSPDGSKVYVTGQSYGQTSNYDYATIAINSTSGNSVWLRRYNGVHLGTDAAESVSVSPDGSKVYVTGYSEGSGSGYDYATIAMSSATGAPIWGQRYNGPGNSNDYAYAVGATPDGLYVYVTGYAYSGASSNDYATVAYLASSGGSVGVRRYNGTGNGSDYANAMWVGPTLIFVTGQSYGGATSDDYATATYQI
jgi:DNA-binding beta-propeller fold protein YncE